LEEFGAQLLVEVFEHVGGARRPERGQECLELIVLEQLGDVREVRWVDLLGLRGDRGRRFIEQRDDVGREQRRDRTVLWISLRWRHGCRPRRSGAANYARRARRDNPLCDESRQSSRDAATYPLAPWCRTG